MNDHERSRAFYELVWPQRAALLRVVRILMGNLPDAEDLAQDTLLKAFKSMERFVGADAKSWLMTILRNARIDRLRAAGAEAGVKHLPLAALESEAELGPIASSESMTATTPADLLEAFSDEELIHALQQLPEEIRWTLLLVDVEGHALGDAATILGVPVGTIKSRTHRGRAMLRQALLPLARDRRLIRE